MSQGGRGRDLFIVDNSVSGWTGLRCLEEWHGIGGTLEIATGVFEIRALLSLNGKWLGLERTLILMAPRLPRWPTPFSMACKRSSKRYVPARSSAGGAPVHVPGPLGRLNAIARGHGAEP